MAFNGTFCQGRFPKLGNNTTESPNIGFIVNTKGDTISCEFKKPLLGELRYKPVNTTEKFKKITTDEVKEYFMATDSIDYISLFADSDSTEPEFYQRLENGKVCLYKKVVTHYNYMNGMMTSSSNTFYFVSKDFGYLREIKSNSLLNDGSRKKRREYLSNLFSDDPELDEKFKNDNNFDFETVRNYVHAYNIYKAKSGATK